VQICYLTCGFVDLQRSVGVCTALMEARIAGVMLLLSGLLTSWKLALDAATKSPKTIISFLDSAKRLEAYLAAQGLSPRVGCGRHPVRAC
jgi:hypothetical protein